MENGRWKTDQAVIKFFFFFQRQGALAVGLKQRTKTLLGGCRWPILDNLLDRKGRQLETPIHLRKVVARIHWFSLSSLSGD